MSKIRYIITIVFVTIYSACYAYDFEVDGIYYNVLDWANGTVEVTHCGVLSSEPYWYYDGYGTKRNSYYYSNYEGQIIVPEIVSYLEREFVVTQIGRHAFAGSKVTSLTLPKTIEDIIYSQMIAYNGYQNRIFWSWINGCEQLKNVCIGNSYCLKKIQETIPPFTEIYLYEGLGQQGDQVWGVKLPSISKLTILQDYISSECSYFNELANMDTLISLSPTPPLVDNKSFTNEQKMNLILYVPEEYIDNYKQSEEWKDFLNLRAMKLQCQISLSDSNLILPLNGMAQLIADVFPKEAYDKSVIWSSSNNAVARVENGLVTAVAKGDAVITATAADGSGVSASCNVHVVDLANSISCKFVDGILTINCDEPNATVYYTIDGTTPTVNSTKYEGPIEIKRNCTVKAFAIYKNFTPSEVVSYVIDGLKVKTPTINFIDSKFVIDAEPTEATI
ncbi:MAG: chitobiase/beta-hexosaminidase C-terminal domain-containing protein, partial [Bacteroidales bacterium]|nr:chitobiase/beta-hexosaminidase C-terminal domain-containing protein [Candidatus Liminaster caballi]